MPLLWEHSLSQLEAHLLPCPFKMLTGCDCPACGLQRSGIHLLRGDVEASFLAHPALIESLFFFLVWWMLSRIASPMAASTRKVGVWVVVGSTLIFYSMKLISGHCCG